MTDTRKKGKHRNQRNKFLHTVWNVIYSLLKWADATKSADSDIIHHIWRISLLRGSGI